MTETRNPSDLFGKGIQLCYCGDKATSLPAEPLDKHSFGCLIWDWALATGKITAAERTAQVEEWSRKLEAACHRQGS